MGLSDALGSQFLTRFPFPEIRLIVAFDTVQSQGCFSGGLRGYMAADQSPCGCLIVSCMGASCTHAGQPGGSTGNRFNVDDRPAPMTIPFGDPEPSDALLGKSVTSTRLRAWLTQRLRQLAAAQRIQDARALRSEFSIE